MKSATVRIRRAHRTTRTIRYRYAKTISKHDGALHPRLKGIRQGMRLTLILLAVSATGEVRSATATILIEAR